QIERGRFFTTGEVERRRRVAVLGPAPAEALPPTVDPIGKNIRISFAHLPVIAVFASRPRPGGCDVGAADLVHSPFRAFVPLDGGTIEQAVAEGEATMRARHGRRVDQPNDCDIVTQDAFLNQWEQISRATFLALVVLSSIALMVGGIGVMSIMTISVTERTREIGVRKALGARRVEILWQFLLEAVFLTSAGGLLGIGLGSLIGFAVHLLTGFPVSLPWWAFAIGIGFSASVGIFFGMIPAIRASRLDPIEALRYE